MSDPEKPGTSRRMSVAGWIAVAVLCGFLAGAVLFAMHTWNEVSGADITPLGWLFMILGAVVTFGVGAGLMALVFYSSREGKDF